MRNRLFIGVTASVLWLGLVTATLLQTWRNLLTQLQHLDQPEPSSPWFTVLVVTTLVTSFLWFLVMVWCVRKPPRARGSAHWATGAEMSSYVLPRQRAEGSFLELGRYRWRRIGLTEEQQEGHLLILAPTGQGKSSRFIIPALLQERGDRSLFIIDPKSELVPITAGAVARHHRCWVFAPEDAEHSHTYNPLAYIRTQEDAQDFAQCWILNTGQSKDRFWDRSVELLVAAVVLHLRATEPDAPLSRLADILCGLSLEELKVLITTSPSALARRVALPFLKNLSNSEKTAAGVLLDLANRFFMLYSEQIQAVTRSNEIDFNSMVDSPTALYLAIPEGSAERLRPLSACLLMQMFTNWIRRAEREPRGRLPRGIACYLDEFTNVGYIPEMAKKVSTLRSKRVALILAMQDFAKVEELYGPTGKKTIQTNTTTHVVLPGIGLDDAEYYSRRLGEQTVLTRSASARGFFGEQTHHTWSEAPRRLMTADEISTMPPGRMLVLVNTLAPVYAKARQPYFQDRALAPLVGLPAPIVARTPPQVPGAPHATGPTTPAPAAAPAVAQQQDGAYLAPE